MGHEYKKGTDMTTTFCTFFPDWLLVICLIVIGGAILLFILRGILVIATLAFFAILYAIKGRWSEFCNRMDNDPTFLTFDKKTGKFNW